MVVHRYERTHKLLIDFNLFYLASVFDIRFLFHAHVIYIVIKFCESDFSVVVSLN